MKPGAAPDHVAEVLRVGLTKGVSVRQQSIAHRENGIEFMSRVARFIEDEMKPR